MRLVPVVLALAVTLVVPVAGRAQDAVRPGGEVTAPRVIKEVKPRYTPSALTARVEGAVQLQCIVRPDGTVQDVKVTVPLHPELDKEAARALSEWRFEPGRRDGKGVPVLVDIELTFTLRDGPPATHKGPSLDAPEVQRPGKEVTAPVVVSERRVGYTPGAIQAKVEGRMKLECVVLPDGTVGDVRMVERLHPELDEEAIRALRQWTFKPGTKNGVAVPVRVEVEMTFTLR
ncbi:MAG TPA: energy transducer TonB [Vicinamibacterales bacterium]|nr:energy transducer TonB [Vicinamibacterales bacterium]